MKYNTLKYSTGSRRDEKANIELEYHEAETPFGRYGIVRDRALFEGAEFSPWRWTATFIPYQIYEKSLEECIKASQKDFETRCANCLYEGTIITLNNKAEVRFDPN